jgi:uracil-DNA glycosylase
MVRSTSDRGKSSREADARALNRLRNQAKGCRNCGLWRNATQTVFGTVHPSSILRAPTEEGRRQAMTDFVADLKRIARRLNK